MGLATAIIGSAVIGAGAAGSASNKAAKAAQAAGQQQSQAATQAAQVQADSSKEAAEISAKAQIEAANIAAQQQREGLDKQLAFQQQGYDIAEREFRPWVKEGDQARAMYNSAFGVNPTNGQTLADARGQFDAGFENSPYWRDAQYSTTQALNALNSTDAAMGKGGLNSGKAQRAAGDLVNNFRGNATNMYLNALGGIVDLGVTGATGVASAGQTLANNNAGAIRSATNAISDYMYDGTSGAGAARANGVAGAGNALAQGYVNSAGAAANGAINAANARAAGWNSAGSIIANAGGTLASYYQPNAMYFRPGQNTGINGMNVPQIRGTPNAFLNTTGGYFQPNAATSMRF